MYRYRTDFYYAKGIPDNDLPEDLILGNKKFDDFFPKAEKVVLAFEENHLPDEIIKQNRCGRTVFHKSGIIANIYLKKDIDYKSRCDELMLRSSKRQYILI
jgi:hypothetical protein